jgi:bifunctional non-homologous end joining protein LigD
VKSVTVPTRVDGHELPLTNLDKVLYPAAGFTKRQVIDYYARIAPVLLPHVAGRPLTLKRYPNGVAGEFFYEKSCPAHRPVWVRTCEACGKEGRRVRYCVIDGLASLVWVANLASLELHVNLALAKTPSRPTAVVFDFDPGAPAGLLDCLWAALEVRKILRPLGLESFPKTSGGKGLHLFIPLNTPSDFDRTKAFARSLSLKLEEKFPRRITSNMRKELRRGKVFMDWSQNTEHKTTVCAYSLRALERPRVSAPLGWAEIERAFGKKDAKSLAFEAGDVLERVRKHGDLFAPAAELKQKLPRVF